MTDPILDGMAQELHEALVERGLNPKDPPTSTKMPSSAAYAEYRKRGGHIYKNADRLAEALVERVTTI